MNYQDFTAIDFAMDEYFQCWVLEDDAEAAQYWQIWLELHPEKKKVIQEARDLLVFPPLNHAEWPTAKQEQLRQRIEVSLIQDNEPLTSKPSTVTECQLNPYWLPMAASVMLMALALYVLFRPSDQTVFSTAYGETKDLQLPDGTQVTLNANSSLRFDNHWQEQEHRQVWLDGEAFFKVTRLSSTDKEAPVKFTVHLNDLDVEVIGTAFNIHHRKKRVEVILNEGIVEVKTQCGEQLRMQPGEKLSYAADTRQISKAPVNPDKALAWRKRQIVVEDQPLADLGQKIQEYYGLEINFSSQELANRKITATLPADDLSVILKSLETIYGIKSERQEKRIIFK